MSVYVMDLIYVCMIVLMVKNVSFPWSVKLRLLAIAPGLERAVLAGIQCHVYFPHNFHTNSQSIVRSVIQCRSCDLLEVMLQWCKRHTDIVLSAATKWPEPVCAPGTASQASTRAVMVGMGVGRRAGMGWSRDIFVVFPSVDKYLTLSVQPGFFRPVGFRVLRT